MESQQVKKFSDFGITHDAVNNKTFKGDKIKPARLINRLIRIHFYEIRPSTKQEGTMCLYLQLSINNEFYVAFTSAKLLMDDIQKVPEFPFDVTIIIENEFYKFR